MAEEGIQERNGFVRYCRSMGCSTKEVKILLLCHDIVLRYQSQCIIMYVI